jgi:hypothetical protein
MTMVRARMDIQAAKDTPRNSILTPSLLDFF